MDENKKQLACETEEFLREFFKYYAVSNKAKDDEQSKDVINAALIYEKIRTAMEYQEEHLVFKNAIARIVRRKYTLLPTIEPEVLTEDLLRELTWANYINPQNVDDDQRAVILKIMTKYLIILKYLRTGIYGRQEASRRVIEWLACELEDLVMPKKEILSLVDFSSKILAKKLELNTKRISPSDSETMIKLIVFSMIFKPDLHSSEYFLLNQIYPDWPSYSNEEAKKFARSFDPYFNKVVAMINHPLKNNYFYFAKNLIPPFIVIRSALYSDKFNANDIIENPTRFEKEANQTYKSLIEEARTKVLRGSIRALIFILLTKVVLAFILEIPFDKFVGGSINYTALLINISLPPILMLLAGTFTKSPSPRNNVSISKSIDQILYENKLGEKTKKLVPEKKANSYQIFNFLYLILNLAILLAIVWGLFQIGFNVLSVFLFFLFVSLVSFFSFRIRSMALVLSMERTSEDMITSFVEFIFLPFIKIGKHISSRFANFNPIILIIDLLIEAPFKSVIRIVNLWNGFVKTKKDELEI